MIVARSVHAETGSAPPIRVQALNDYLIYFFDGRRPAERYSKDWNWLDDAAMKLGVGTYAIHRGDEAIVYDTFTSVPQAKFVRDYLEKMGIKKFTVVHSHWHLDHVAGDAVYDDSDVVATTATRDALAKQKADIESGKLWGPPPITPVRIPNVTFDDKKQLKVGDIDLELRRINIHSVDGLVIYIPKDKILLAGDTLEDSLTYMIEVENLAEHVKNLKDMRTWDVAKIFPNHGDPDIIMKGGYDKTFIDATAAYVTKMLGNAHDSDYLQGTMEDYIGDAAAKGWVHIFEPYREVHTQNLKLVHDYWKDKELPEIAP
jgi:glyoxylase-like metal-dependent hydrolase (beta-lactamase superfamily II)